MSRHRPHTYNRWARIRRRLFELACAPTVDEALSESDVRLNLWPHATGLLTVGPSSGRTAQTVARLTTDR